MITYKEETITTRAKKIEDEAYAQHECIAKVAYLDDKPTGLAYHTSVDSAGEHVYSLTHVPSGAAVLGNTYDMGSEKAMKHWIELCLEFANWTGQRPIIISTKHAIKYAAIGAFEQA